MPLRKARAELAELMSAVQTCREGKSLKLKVANPAMAKQRLFTARMTRGIATKVVRVDPEDSNSAVKSVEFDFANEDNEDGGTLTLMRE